MKSKKNANGQRIDKPHQKKKVLSMKSKKSLRGIPENPYGELKKPVSFSLTPSAVELLKQFAHEQKISCSELLERLARGLFSRANPKGADRGTFVPQS